MSSSSERSNGLASAWASARAHPVITTTLLFCTVFGAVLGFFLLTEDWIAARRILAGAVAGAGTGLLITATKMLG